MIAHKEKYPEQYSHKLCGKSVKVRGETTTYVVERVITTMFGLLAPVPDSDMAYSVDQLAVVE